MHQQLSSQSFVTRDIAQVLIEAGVRDFFGLVGSGNFYVTNALIEQGASLWAARHENVAVTMADGYARSTGRLGVVSLTTGPGLSNGVTALAEAAKARTPMLVLAGDVPGRAVRNNFRIDQHTLVKSVDVVAERIHSPQTAIADTRRALRIALTESRPVVLMMPTDVQEAQSPGGYTSEEILFPSKPSPTPEAIDQIVERLLNAKRPLIIAGRGVVNADQGEQLAEIAAHTGALLANSVLAKDMFVDDPFTLGISGGFGTPLSVELISEADCILAIGISLSYWTTRHGELLQHCESFIQVDHNPRSLGAAKKPDLAVIADAGLTIAHLAEQVTAAGIQREGWRTEEMRQRIAAEGSWNALVESVPVQEDVIDPRRVSALVDDILPKDRALSIDSGHFLGFPARHIAVPDARSFLFLNAFQSVGLGLGAGMGAALGDRSRPTIVAIGDGGLTMTLGDLETVARYNLPILVLVYNDSAAGAEVHHFGPLGEDLDLVVFPDVDFAKIAESVGIPGITVRTAADLDQLKSWAAAPNGPILVDAKIDGTVKADYIEHAFTGDAH